MKILFVCLGNICRSPIAEGLLQSKATLHNLDWTIDSAATEDFHIGQAPHSLSQKVCQVNGIDISHQKARKFSSEDLRKYDLIFALAEDVLMEMNEIAMEEFDPKQVMLVSDVIPDFRYKSIPDPYYGDYNLYEKVYEIIEEITDAIIHKYK